MLAVTFLICFGVDACFRFDIRATWKLVRCTASRVEELQSFFMLRFQPERVGSSGMIAPVGLCVMNALVELKVNV
jgi:hypothetical protein